MNILFLNGPGFDYLTSQLCEGFHLLHKEGKIGFKCLHRNIQHGAQVVDMKETSIEEALDSIDWADFILFSFAGDMTQIDAAAGNFLHVDSIQHKRVFIDGHDGDAFLVDPTKQLIYFKREMRYPMCNALSIGNVRSLVFGVYQYLIDNREWTGTIEEDWEKRDVQLFELPIHHLFELM